ncbi:usp domain-containing protein [Colletotrichum truncatum]|uniref:Usp domain-containing protein n=1 Tax=Colletotrichum truncatum TaxID=5467 RepID=A0ACC3YQV0_COLTU|nr:usp domain-containing protein [Colletotrichum truncatum]KAF6799011.1 usp domain-containing protein [Colletotrichum truncatum]
MSRQPMSMEAMLDEERRDVLALLEGTTSRPSWNSNSPVSARSPSPYTSPRSPVRSMLDIGDEGGKKSPARTTVMPVRSMLDIDAPPAPVRSMLDIDTSAPKQVASAGPSSPVESRAPHPRTFSDSHSGPKPSFGPRAPINRLDPTSDYQFSDIATNNIGQAMPKRNTQGGRKTAGGVMADVMRGNEIPGIVLPGERARHGSIASNPVPRNARSSSRGNNSKSKSPHGRLGMRSPSPNVSGRFQQIPGTAMLDDGRVVDITRAYRKLSDANLAFSKGNLGELATRKKSNASERNGGRLTKDYLSPDGEELEESSDEEHSFSDEEQHRGRKMSPRSADDTSKSSAGDKGERKTLSLLAAAEEERLEVSAQQPQYQYKSLLDDPQITLTTPTGEKAKPSKSKSGVHPTTAFDQGPGSGPASAVNSDDEEALTDIKRAQRLAFSSTGYQNYDEHSRTLRIIYRGEWEQIQKAAEEEHHRLRKYLVATDLSDESTHALEWAIGTVLRDGDTLICMYCVDEETGIYSTDGVMVPDDPKAHREQAAALTAISNSKTTSAISSVAPAFPHLPRASALRTDSHGTPSPAPSSRERGRAEEERLRAIDDITERVTKLLRKTRLQVRVIVEVLHCKNPKHLITEIIDLLNPTLVILGSRGRSALKGVILGSFSNYLVTKSSVPVMVARKRLRKQSKYKRPMKQVNIIHTPGAKSLANAKVD